MKMKFSAKRKRCEQCDGTGEGSSVGCSFKAHCDGCNGKGSIPLVDVEALRKELIMAPKKAVFSFTRDELMSMIGETDGLVTSIEELVPNWQTDGIMIDGKVCSKELDTLLKKYHYRNGFPQSN
jgi:hypothetical protein